MQTLTKVEEDIMQYIWQLGECMVTDIIAAMGKEDIPHSTISSVVRLLEKKNFVDHKTYGKTHLYYAIITKNEYVGSKISGLVGNFFDKNPASLVSFLVRNDDIDVNELNDLYKLLKKAK